MSDIAITVFGTTGGVKTAILPEGFPLPDPLYQMVDTSLPFVWGKPVYRFQSHDESHGVLHFFAVYTKIDDLGGSRDGAFAGAGIFVRNGRCDSQVVTTTLTQLIGLLINEASDGHQFVIPIQQAVSKLRDFMAGALEELSKAFIRGGAVRTEGRASGQRGLCANDDWFIATPAHYFEAARVNINAEFSDYYYSTDEEFLRTLRDWSDVRRVTVSRALIDAPIVAQERMTEMRSQYDGQLAKEREERQNIESEFSAFRTAEIERVAAATQQLRNDVTMLQQTDTALRERLRTAQRATQQLRDDKTMLQQTNTALRERLQSAQRSKQQLEEQRRNLVEDWKVGLGRAGGGDASDDAAEKLRVRSKKFRSGRTSRLAKLAVLVGIFACGLMVAALIKWLKPGWLW